MYLVAASYFLHNHMGGERVKCPLCLGSGQYVDVELELSKIEARKQEQDSDNKTKDEPSSPVSEQSKTDNDASCLLVNQKLQPTSSNIELNDDDLNTLSNACASSSDNALQSESDRPKTKQGKRKKRTNIDQNAPFQFRKVNN